jgi:hypothetical protein
VKRTALIFLTAIYLLSCVGIGINRFYCCGKLASVKLTYVAADNTESKSDKTKDNCCKNVNQNFKIKDTHFSAASLSLGTPLPVVLSSSFGLNHIAVKALPMIGSYRTNAPPEYADIPAYTLNCTYRI